MEKDYVTVNRILTKFLVSIIIVGCMINGAFSVVAYTQDVEIKNLENELEKQELEYNYDFSFDSLERISIENQSDVDYKTLTSLQEQEEQIQKETQNNTEQFYEFPTIQLNEEPKTEQSLEPEEQRDLNENVSNVEQETIQLVEETRGTVNEETLETALEEKQEEKYEKEKAKVDQNDVELLAQLMYAEEGILYTQHYLDDPETVEKVFKCCGSCPIHRMELKLYNANSLEDVIFSTAYDIQTIQRIEEGQDIPDDIYRWAEELLVEGPIGPKGLIYQSEFHQGDETYYEAYNQFFCVETKYN